MEANVIFEYLITEKPANIPPQATNKSTSYPLDHGACPPRYHRTPIPNVWYTKAAIINPITILVANWILLSVFTIHRADKLTGPYEGKVILQNKGVAQGCLIDTPDGKWYAMLFQDNGAVGRSPWLVPVKWEDGWPVLGVGGKAPVTLEIDENKTNINKNRI